MKPSRRITDANSATQTYIDVMDEIAVAGIEHKISLKLGERPANVEFVIRGVADR